MSTPFDAIFGDVANDLVGLFGVQQGGSDPVKGQYEKVTFGAVDLDTNEATKAANAQTIDMSPPLKYKTKDLVPQLIEADDCKVIISGQDWVSAFPSETPAVGDILTINGENFFVVNPNPIYSGNDVAAYKMQCRQGHSRPTRTDS